MSIISLMSLLILGAMIGAGLSSIAQQPQTEIELADDNLGLLKAPLELYDEH